jgi:hypothetical protein
MAFENRSRGFNDNGTAGPLEWVNNIAYRNGSVSFQGGDLNHVLLNNIAVGPANRLSTRVDQRFNSWNVPVVADDADFESVDSRGAQGARALDGSRPRPDFLRLRPGSDLRGAGQSGVNLGP